MGINTIRAVSLLIIFILSLFTILLLHIGRHTKSNIYLAIYFISQIVVELCFFIPAGNLFFLLLVSVSYAWGQLYYFFIVSLFNPDFTFKTRSLYHFIPVLFALALLICKQYSVFGNNNFLPFVWISMNYDKLLDFLFNTTIIVYSLAIIFRYLFQFSKLNGSKTSTVWSKFAVFGFFLSSLIVQFINHHPVLSEHKFISGNGIFLIFFCILLYIAIINRTITDKLLTIEKYKKSSLNNTISKEILEQIEAYMHKKKAYLDSELNLKNLSATLEIQEKYISEVINRLKGMNFSEFINFYRISHAMELLEDPELKDKTMLYILFESGFNSKTTFNTRFKQIVGCTPLEYKRRLNN